MKFSMRWWVVVLLVGSGCHGAHSAVQRPGGLGSQLYVDATDGIRFDYPAGWTTGKGKTAVVEVTDPQTHAKLDLNVPVLPALAHLPGVLTVDRVANGYIGDMKRNKIPDAVVEQCDVTVAGAKARRIKLTGDAGGQAVMDEAVAIVHGGKVFIFSIDADEAGYSAASAALNAAVDSIQWSD